MAAKRKPSEQLKARLERELLSEVDSMGKMARRLCESSQSQQVSEEWSTSAGEGSTSAGGGVHQCKGRSLAMQGEWPTSAGGGVQQCRGGIYQCRGRGYLCLAGLEWSQQYQ